LHCKADESRSRAGDRGQADHGHVRGRVGRFLPRRQNSVISMLEFFLICSLDKVWAKVWVRNSLPPEEHGNLKAL
jgi:hypothetical protein